MEERVAMRHLIWKLLSRLKFSSNSLFFHPDPGTGDISLKKLDPAVLDFHSRKNSLTRYGMEELMNLKDTRHAQSPPSCLFDPNLLRLGIFTDHPSPYQTYRQQLQNITMPKFDSNLLKLLNSIKGPSIPYG